MIFSILQVSRDRKRLLTAPARYLSCVVYCKKGHSLEAVKFSDCTRERPQDNRDLFHFSWIHTFSATPKSLRMWVPVPPIEAGCGLRPTTPCANVLINLLKCIHSTTFCNSVLTNFCNSIQFPLEIHITVSSEKRVELNADAFGKSFTYRAKSNVLVMTPGVGYFKHRWSIVPNYGVLLTSLLVTSQ